MTSPMDMIVLMLKTQHEVEHMCDILLGRYMYAACNNTI
jgi:hypothetical protein